MYKKNPIFSLLKWLPAGCWPESESDLGPLVLQRQAVQDECTGAGQYLHVPTPKQHKGETKFELEQRSLKVAELTSILNHQSMACPLRNC